MSRFLIRKGKEVRSKSTGLLLGRIEFYKAWDQYVFCPLQGTVFNNTCLRDIAGWLTQFNATKDGKID